MTAKTLGLLLAWAWLAAPAAAELSVEVSAPQAPILLPLLATSALPQAFALPALATVAAADPASAMLTALPAPSAADYIGQPRVQITAARAQALSAAAPDFTKMSAAGAKDAAATDFIGKIKALLESGAPPSAPPAPAKDDWRKTEVLKLRMTQMAVGMREVAVKADKLREILKKDGSQEALDFIKKHEIPAVIGPGGELYIIDHHHLVRAAWEAGITDVHVKVRADFSKLSKQDFWLKMAEAKWVYPYDQLGNGPHDPVLLPEDVRGLANDPFRDVAWQVRERGGYDKNTAPFSEFRWANFFRKNLKTYPTFRDFEAAVVEAVKLAKSELAKDLPGYKGGK